MPIPTIHVGCRHFGHGRLQALVNCKGLEPVACVDIDVEGSRTARPCPGLRGPKVVA